MRSGSFDKGSNNPLLSGFFKVDRQLVAADRVDFTVAELLMKDAFTFHEGRRCRVARGNQIPGLFNNLRPASPP